MTALPPDAKARVLAAVRREPAPTRAESRRVAAIVVVAGFAAMIGVLMLLGGAMGGGRPASYLVLSSAGWLVMAGIATWGAAGRGGRMIGRPAAWLRSVALLTSPVMAGWILLAYVAWPETGHLGCPPAADYGCLGFTLVLALGPFGAFLFARRRTDPVHPRLSGAALGAAAGAWGAVAMHARCFCADPYHLLLAHVVPIAFFSALGWLLGGWALGLGRAPTRAPPADIIAGRRGQPLP